MAATTTPPPGRKLAASVAPRDLLGRVAERDDEPLAAHRRADMAQLDWREKHGTLICGWTGGGRRKCRRAPALSSGGRCLDHLAPEAKPGSRRFAAELRGRMARAYEASLDDPQQAGLREELALLDATLVDLAAEVGRLSAKAEESPLGPLEREELRRLRRDVGAMVETRSRLAESMTKLEALLSPAEVAEFGQRIISLVLRHVPEQDRREAIARDFQALVVGDRTVWAQLPPQALPG